MSSFTSKTVTNIPSTQLIVFEFFYPLPTCLNCPHLTHTHPPSWSGMVGKTSGQFYPG